MKKPIYNYLVEIKRSFVFDPFELNAEHIETRPNLKSLNTRLNKPYQCTQRFFHLLKSNFNFGSFGQLCVETLKFNIFIPG